MVNGYSNLGPDNLYLDEERFDPLRIVYSGVFDRHPEAKLIIGHLGEMLAFFAWRIQRAFEYNPYSQRTRKRLQDYLSDNIWVTTSGNFSDQALITTLLTVGADHILFASDYPPRDVHRRGSVDRNRVHQRKRPPKDLLRQRRGPLRPPQMSFRPQPLAPVFIASLPAGRTTRLPAASRLPRCP
jgi:hypothetical protein